MKTCFNVSYYIINVKKIDGELVNSCAVSYFFLDDKTIF